VLLDAHAAAYLHLHRTVGFGGRPPAIGTIATWARWTADTLRGRAEVALRERLGPDAWVGVLATGKLAPPFSLVGELPNGTPALDFIGVDWAGVVALPGEARVGDDDAARDQTLQRLGGLGKPIFLPSGERPAGVGVRWVG